MAVFSCLKYKTIPTSCIEYVHPWTDSCRDAWIGLLLHSFRHSLRTYTTLYLLTAIMRQKKPSKKLILETIAAILQSTVFLTTHAYGFAVALCTLRKLTGSFNMLSVSFTPAFLSSLVAIHLERPSRRPILCLYVTNVATETLFHMAVDRGWVTPIRYGEVAIFAASIASLLYRFRGDHPRDQIFSLLRFVVGPDEENVERIIVEREPESPQPGPSHARRNQPAISLSTISNALRVYKSFVDFMKATPKSACCLHSHGCIHYVVKGGAKMLALGYAVQVLLRTVLSLGKISRRPSLLLRNLVADNVLGLGAFLGCFTATFRGVSCLLRWLRGKDSQIHAIPAGLLAGLAFNFYPGNTAALYVMWKSIQMAYTDAVDAGYLPEIPFGTIILYCFSTSVLFHAAFLEPQNLRSNYVRFLDGLSGGRIVAMARRPLDSFGLDTSRHLAEVLAKLKINPDPRYSLRIFGNPYPPIP